MTASTPETTRPPSTVKVALLGAGNVGAEVARTLLDHGPEFAARVGAPVELVGIAVRDLTARRTVELPAIPASERISSPRFVTTMSVRTVPNSSSIRNGSSIALAMSPV